MMERGLMVVETPPLLGSAFIHITACEIIADFITLGKYLNGTEYRRLRTLCLTNLISRSASA